MTPAPHEVPAERLLPHRAPMLALERLDAWSPGGSSASFTLAPGALCFEDGRFRPAWCVELMAQAVAAGVAYGAAIADAPREAAGFVVGVEDVRAAPAGKLAPGARVRIESTLDVDLPPAAELSARLFVGEAELARARLRVLVGGAQGKPAAADAPRFDGFQGCRFERRDGATFAIAVGAGHPYLAGHFPGFPVLPAVGQLRLVEHAASLAAGAPRLLAEIERARFQEPIVPGDALELALEPVESPRISWTFRRAGRRVASGSGLLGG